MTLTARGAPADAYDLPKAVLSTDPQHWSKKPALWTDLNEPVKDLTRLDASGGPLMTYPIFDANYLVASATDAKVGQLSLEKNKTVSDVEGFRIEEFDTRKATMPVRWLYMLKDGTLVGAKEKGDGDADLIVPSGKTKMVDGKPNPIVARVAFWTDDDTAKVNINTASEGTFGILPCAIRSRGNSSTARTARPI
jgi:hypothetical protein